MPRIDKLVINFARLVRLLRWGNLLFLVWFVGVIVASIVFREWVDARLLTKYGPALDRDGVLNGFRLLTVVGIVAVGAVDRLLRALLAILGTVEAGDPFVAGNASRLRAIGWALLVLQLLDLGVGGLTAWLSRLGVEIVDWSPSVTGWLAVLTAFVLARVFLVGARMRDELEGTV